MNPTRSVSETWLPVPGWDGYYEVSDQGRTRSVDRVILRATGSMQRCPGRMLSATSNQSGYRYVSLSRGGSRRKAKVHRMVMAAFVGPCPDGMEVCHNNGDPSDNRLVNLRYDTASGNMYDRRGHGTDHEVNKTHCPRGHALQEPNLVDMRWTRAGHRNCKACTRAQSYMHKREELDTADLPAIADKYYDDIIRHGGVTQRPEKCSRGHELRDPNILAWAKARGHRTCKSCNRAHQYRYKHPDEDVDIQMKSDEFYRQTMEGTE